jgi:hypothetical protein
MTGPWIASMLDPSERDAGWDEVKMQPGAEIRYEDDKWRVGDVRLKMTSPGVWEPIEPSDRDDRDVREKIEDQREADFYRDDPDELPLDVEGDDGAS